jgi:hypothetical protein
MYCLYCGHKFELWLENGKIQYPEECPGCDLPQLLTPEQEAEILQKLKVY